MSNLPSTTLQVFATIQDLGGNVVGRVTQPVTVLSNPSAVSSPAEVTSAVSEITQNLTSAQPRQVMVLVASAAELGNSNAESSQIVDSSLSRATMVEFLSNNSHLVLPDEVLTSLKVVVSQDPAAVASQVASSSTALVEKVANSMPSVGNETVKAAATAMEVLSLVLQVPSLELDSVSKAKGLVDTVLNLHMKAAGTSAGAKKTFSTISFEAAALRTASVAGYSLAGLLFSGGTLSASTETNVLHVVRFADSSQVATKQAPPDTAYLVSSMYSITVFDGSTYSKVPVQGLSSDQSLRFNVPTETAPFGGKCKWWNGQTKAWLDTGVSTESNGGVFSCSTTHLTDFAILGSYGQGFFFFGNPLFIGFGPVYLLIAVVSLVQFFRVFVSSKWEHYLLTTEHLLLFAFTLARGSNCILFYLAKPCSAITGGSSTLCLDENTLMLMLALPYWFLFWIFDFLIFVWITLVHFATGTAMGSGFRKVAPYFFGINIVLLVVFLVLFELVRRAKPADKTSLANIGSAILSATMLVLSISFAVYGITVAKRLTEDFPSKYSSKLMRTAVIVCVALCVQATINLVTIVDRESFARNFTPFQCVYFGAELSAVVVLLFMFKSAVHRTLSVHKDHNKRVFHKKKKLQANHHHGREKRGESTGGESTRSERTRRTQRRQHHHEHHNKSGHIHKKDVHHVEHSRRRHKHSNEPATPLVSTSDPKMSLAEVSLKLSEENLQQKGNWGLPVNFFEEVNDVETGQLPIPEQESTPVPHSRDTPPKTDSLDPEQQGKEQLDLNFSLSDLPGTVTRLLDDPKSPEQASEPQNLAAPPLVSVSPHAMSVSQKSSSGERQSVSPSYTPISVPTGPAKVEASAAKAPVTRISSFNVNEPIAFRPLPAASLKLSVTGWPSKPLERNSTLSQISNVLSPVASADEVSYRWGQLKLSLESQESLLSNNRKLNSHSLKSEKWKVVPKKTRNTRKSNIVFI
mmetsp:Transcript_14874/g.29171  ORF Transcript_14874/g.29171 Transcript_14874/m.29171 type:complete len:974 (-) Transcript_14874:390-3311(-)